MNSCKIFICRIISESSKYISRDISSSFRPALARRQSKKSDLAMAQRSITSFFKNTPPKSGVGKKAVAVTAKDIKVAPVPDGKDKRSSKRPRLDSSSSETEVKTTSISPKLNSDKKKNAKRQRIESSDSESESPETNGNTSPKSEIETSPKTDTKSPKSEPTSDNESPKSITSPQKLAVKVEKTDSPKTYASPKTKKRRPKLTETSKSSPKEKKAAKVKKDKISDEKIDIKSCARSPSPTHKNVKNEVCTEINTNGEDNILEETEPEDDAATPVAEFAYKPAKAGYHPRRDASWRRGQAVPYLALAKTFEAIEPTSARLKIIEILSNFFRSVIVLTPEDLLPCVYMCLNQLAPAYHSVELGIAETYLMKAVGACTGLSLGQVRGERGGRGEDLGLVAERARAAQRTMFPQPALTVRKVFATLRDIAHMTGQASVNKKIAKIQSLYIACRHCEARYLIRSLEGKLRIGLAEQSVLQALALATATTPPELGGRVLDASKGMSADKFKAVVEQTALIIKTTYCECPNYDEVVPALLRGGARALPACCRLAAGVPLKPMLAHPTKGVHEIFNRFEGEEFTCEWKYDGERAQIHVPGGDAPDLARAAIFSRNQENNTSKYPDILRRLPSLLKETVSSCVLDCEAVAYDTTNKQILPFQILSTRKRKDAEVADIKVQVCVFVFDCLFLNGRPLVARPLAERRALLREHFREVEGEWQFATSRDCGDMEDVQQFLEEAVRGSCEGLMVKALSGDRAKYDIARRSHNWLKLKKDYLDGVGDTIDVVVIGAYCGRGKRRGGYGGFLAACYDPDTECYQALCKLGTGFSDDELATFTESLGALEVPQPRSYYSFSPSLAPDVWLSPAAVWEVRCADLSLSPAHRAAIGLVDPHKGISLRFPRFVRVRDDKCPEQATTARQVADMYLAQDQVKNSSKAHAHTNADDFY